MALNAKTAAGTGKKREKLEPGTYPARIVQVIDIGLQPQQYKGEKKDPARMALITYEFLDEFLKDEDGNDIEDKPRWLSESFVLYNLAADKAKSTIRYKAIDPTMSADGDWTRLLDTPVMVNVVHNPNPKDPSNPYENIGGVTRMRDKDARKAPALVNKAVFFDLDDPSLEVFNSLVQWLQDKIKSNLEFNGSNLQRMLGGEAVPDVEAPNSYDDLDDEIPF